MAATTVTYMGDGSTSTFGVPFPYINKEDVKVSVNGIGLLYQLEWRFLNDSTIQIVGFDGVPNPPKQGDTVIITRRTNRDQRLVDFTNGAVLTEQELDLSATQLFYLIQENFDLLSQLVSGGLKDLNGLVDLEGDGVLSDLINSILSSEVANEIQQRISDIEANATELAQALVDLHTETLARIAGDNNLQTQVNQLVQATSALVFVQDEPPVPGQNGVPDPIPAGARWYDSDDNNHPYIWDPVGLQWLSLEDPRIGQNASDIAALKVVVYDPNTGVAANASAISVLDTTVTTHSGQISALSSDISALEATVNDPVTGVVANADAISALDIRITAAEGEIGANAADIAALQATVNDPETGVNANAAAIGALGVRVTSAEGTISTNAAAITALEATVNDPQTGVAANANAISGLDTRVTAAEGEINSHSSQLLALESTVNHPQTGVSANASAISALDTRVTAAEGGITAIASDLSVLETEVDGNTATVASLSQSVNGLEARYGVSLNVNGYITGFVQNNDGDSGTFDILTDKFRVVDPANGGQNPRTVFAIQNGNVVLQNLLVSGSLLVDGSVGAVKIADGAITAPKINVANLQAINANTGALTVNGLLTLAANGALRIGKTSAGSTANGIWIGHDGGSNYDLHIGNSSRYLRWDGSAGTLTVSGVLTGTNEVETFVPGWETHFNTNPSGSLKYIDLGVLVIMWADSALTGTPDGVDPTLIATGVPSSIRPVGNRMVACQVITNNVPSSGRAQVQPNGQITFYLDFADGPGNTIVPRASFFSHSGSKGIPAGWIIMYSK